MRIKFVLISILSISLFVFSCQEETPFEQDNASLNPKSPQNKINSIASTAVSSNGSYIIIAAGNSLPNNLNEAVTLVNGTVTNLINQIGIAVATSEDPDFIANASKIAGVRSVVPNYNVNWIDPEMEVVEADFENPPTSGDDDFFFDLQWGHDAVDAVEAWNAGYRGDGVRVFILDSGIDAEHPDLAPNLNTTLSKSFVPGEDWNVRPGYYFNHGSHVAGTVAAADNGFGVIGVAPEAELVAVKVLSEYSGSGQFAWLVEALVYAADNGADVINMSLGAYFPRHIYGKDAAELAVAVGKATTYAYQKGATVIASAGNNSADRDHDADGLVLPADGANVIAISATAPEGWAANPATDLDVPSLYTNIGQSRVDFAAPGGDYSYAFEPGGFDLCTVGTLTRYCYVFDFVFSTSSGGWYWAYGTSMAAPHATGVAAIIIGKNGGSMHPAQVEAALRASADDLGKPGKDDYYGLGRVNAYNAVK